MDISASAGATPFEPQLNERGIISQGWVIVSYEGKLVSLLGKGDRVCTPQRGSAITLRPLGPLRLDRDTTSHSDMFPGTLAQSLARQAVRLSISAPARTADFFVELADKVDPEGMEPLTIELPLSQGELAQLLGMSTVHMNRTLMLLKNMGCLTHAKGVFTITDRCELAALMYRLSNGAQ